MKKSRRKNLIKIFLVIHNKKILDLSYIEDDDDEDDEDPQVKKID